MKNLNSNLVLAVLTTAVSAQFSHSSGGPPDCLGCTVTSLPSSITALPSTTSVATCPVITSTGGNLTCELPVKSTTICTPKDCSITSTVSKPCDCTGSVETTYVCPATTCNEGCTVETSILLLPCPITTSSSASVTIVTPLTSNFTATSLSYSQSSGVSSAAPSTIPNSPASGIVPTSVVPTSTVTGTTVVPATGSATSSSATTSASASIVSNEGGKMTVEGLFAGLVAIFVGLL